MTHKALRMCVDRIVPLHLKTRAADLAIRERSDNHPGVLPKRVGASANPAKIALVTGKMWTLGRVLRVHFLDGSSAQRARVQEFATEWCNYANIGLDFGGGPDSEIRISFVADAGSWSAVGTDCLVGDYFKAGEPTMNFGWLRDDTDDTEFRRVTTHEFGHALGAIHEHQNPFGSSIQWDVAAVYQYFSGPPNYWSKEDIDFNVLQKYSADQLNGTQFDPESIMLYSFDPSLTLNHVGTANNTDLSDGDKQFIAQTYPSLASSVSVASDKFEPNKRDALAWATVEIVTQSGNRIYAR